MPRRRTGQPPKYRHHKARNLAKVTIDRRDIYLGTFNSPESWQKYADVLAALQRGLSVDRIAISLNSDNASEATSTDSVRPSRSRTTIGMLSLQYFEYAKVYYAARDGGSSGRLSNVKTAIREVNNLFSGLDVVEFGPLKFAAVRDAMIARGLERNYINDLMSIVVLMFNWGVEQEFVPVVGGFTGRAPDGRLCTLGRGGSDYTAVALGAALGASVELCKADTDGVYDCDPNSNSDAERFDTMTYDEAFSLASEGAKVLHDKAARSAREGEVELTVRHTFDDGPGTRIGPVADAARHVPITVPVPVTTK